MAKFKQACFAHDLSKKVHTFSRHGKVQASLLCSWLIEKVPKLQLLYIIQCLNSAAKLLLYNLRAELRNYLF